MKTYAPKASEIVRDWHLFDAEGQVLGRLCTQIAVILMNKNKPTFARNIDAGDHVVVINAAKVVATGRKEEQKLYHRHSGYPGGMVVTTLRQVRASHPERIIEHAVSGMLPDNKLKSRVMRHLHIYEGAEHPYTKQFKKA
jgi:large subunit ribosomal protein L13